jgi:RAMA domain-containing protein
LSRTVSHEELRERLLAWYFDRTAPSIVNPQPAASIDEAPSITIDPNVDSRRITFPELVKAGLLRPGQSLRCRPLKRQKRNGLDTFIEGAKVADDGSVAFQGNKFFVPSQLVKAMLNANGGKVVASNGYDYIFVEGATGLVRLSELRQQLMGASPLEEAAVAVLMPEGAFGTKEEALKWVRENKFAE